VVSSRTCSSTGLVSGFGSGMGLFLFRDEVILPFPRGKGWQAAAGAAAPLHPQKRSPPEDENADDAAQDEQNEQAPHATQPADKGRAAEKDPVLSDLVHLDLHLVTAAS
jgi:hypothetical protein